MKKVCLFCASVFLAAFGIFIYNLGKYYYHLYALEERTVTCASSTDGYRTKDDNTVCQNCYTDMYEVILPKLLTFNATSDGKKLEFSKYKPCYVIPKIILEKADAMISYGVKDDMNTEEEFSRKYNKPSYSFDCGIKSIEIPYEKCHFESSCIGTDKYILRNEGQVSSMNIHTFGQKIKELGYENKKVIVQMDIAGAEKEVLPDILQYSDKITGIVFVLHIEDAKSIVESLSVLDLLKKDFVLVCKSNHFAEPNNGKTCKYLEGNIAPLVALSYVNKSLLDSYSLNFEDKNTFGTNDKNLIKLIPSGRTDKIVIIAEKLRNMFYK